MAGETAALRQLPKKANNVTETSGLAVVFNYQTSANNLGFTVCKMKNSPFVNIKFGMGCFTFPGGHHHRSGSLHLNGYNENEVGQSEC